MYLKKIHCVLELDLLNWTIGIRFQRFMGSKNWYEFQILCFIFYWIW